MPKKKKIIFNKSKGKPFNPIIQKHHITYNPSRTVLVYKGEHYILTQLQWRKYVSKGLITALQQFVKDYKGIAQPLRRTRKKTTRKTTVKSKTSNTTTRRKRGTKGSNRKTRKAS